MQLNMYPPEMLLRKYKSFRRELLAENPSWLDKRIAILGGSTTTDIRKMLELFLLSHGIRGEFYESEYGRYWEDAMFGTQELLEFHPDIIFIHTSNRNIIQCPVSSDNAETVNALLETEYNRFAAMWEKLSTDYQCPIIQNNFEYPFWRLLGNADASFVSGRVNFITRLNLKFAEYAQSHSNFYINDINWLSADYGLEAWSAPYYWHMYKYVLALPAIPRLGESVANIIKSIYGKNKKAFALDLDNTLWGGIVGDDGPENLQIGQETSVGQVYSEFQQYLKAHEEIGVILNVVSKNEMENALAGLKRPDSILKPEDFIAIKANWNPKSENIQEIAQELSLLPESFVFVDDNPAERAIINQAFPLVPTPEMDRPENYIKAIDRGGYFEVTTLTKDDISRGIMYKENAARTKQQASFTDYEEYLRSLEMTAEIKPFIPMYFSRIVQLTNKSNQFNLTTLRCTQEEIQYFAENSKYITLYGKLQDKFGDNGVVSIVVGEIDGIKLHIRLWLMSCRVLKRDMEFAMMKELVREASHQGIKTIYGYYYPTAKNKMVQSFYDKQGFTKQQEDKDGNTVWRLDITSGYQGKETAIQIN
ncbi:MAG: HAD-IIIC family phosphatase [Oscillospiraceae bacterium]|nr:HAD-IIIC family phosphatase [Oscillospiraceae bacterium]MCI8956708.1 HAD-IIIC family phosphatase [Eubacterium sp.]MCI9526863.1 HAD-IIIC family phosphatase [Lachnospiraceae bacterium]